MCDVPAADGVQECEPYVICSEWPQTCRSTGLIPHRRGQTEQLLWQHRGWQTFESPPDAVCCAAHVTALWWRSEVRQANAHPTLHLLDTLSIIHACTVTWHFSPFPPLFITACHKTSFFPPSLISLTLPTHYSVFSLPPPLQSLSP